MKLLNGQELASFIKQRQADLTADLLRRQIHPKLVIIQTRDHPIINTYVQLKQRYGQDIKVEVVVKKISEDQALQTIQRLNDDDSVHGIIVQLPLSDQSQTDELLQAVSPTKDVDGLSGKSKFLAATPQAILWLLAGYNIDLNDKLIAVVGQGRLVGAPLTKQLLINGHKVLKIDKQTGDLSELQKAKIVITATGQPGLITAEMLAEGSVVIDAGVASESGKTLGDLSPEVYERQDLTLTPQKGGVGPLTVCALFENTILSAQGIK